jgi:hypothetical protein
VTGDPFDELVADVMTRAQRFGHRQHIEVTWLAVRRFGRDAAVDLVSAGIQRTARYAGAPQKYHVTISRAWVHLVAFHIGGETSFDAFVERAPALLDKRLLTRHYRPATLASARARAGWVEPDLRPLPGEQLRHSVPT